MFHAEVKRVQALHLESAMAQAIAQAGEDQIPYVAHRRNHSEWKVTMLATDWFKLVREFVE